MEKKVVGVYAPANAAHIWFEEKYLFAKKQLENMGFEIVEGNLVKNKIYQRVFQIFYVHLHPKPFIYLL